MEDKIIEMVDKLAPQMIEDIQQMVKIDSRQVESSENAHFGIKIKKALETILSISEREGLTIKNLDNYLGYAQLGDNKEYIGIFGHIDVVDIDGKWNYPPFGAVISENKIYGRGTLDNKGPLIAALYAVIVLKKLNVDLKYAIRVIFGTNEETGMKDIPYYFKYEDEPLIGFTPDNKFPAIYGERGRMIIKISGDIDDMLNFINKYIICNGDIANKLGIDFDDNDFGKLLVTKTEIINEKNILSLKLIICYPNCDLTEIISKIKKCAINLKVEIEKNIEPMMVDKNSKLITILNQAYNDFMKTNLRPTTTKGMTYAHIIDNIVPFGPSFPNQNGIAHLPDEYIDIDDIINCCKIYAIALYRLLKKY